MRTIKGTDLLDADFYAIVTPADGSFAIPDYKVEESSVFKGMVNVPVALGTLYLDMDKDYEVVESHEELIAFIAEHLR